MGNNPRSSQKQPQNSVGATLADGTRVYIVIESAKDETLSVISAYSGRHFLTGTIDVIQKELNPVIDPLSSFDEVMH